MCLLYTPRVSSSPTATAGEHSSDAVSLSLFFFTESFLKHITDFGQIVFHCQSDR